MKHSIFRPATLIFPALYPTWFRWNVIDFALMATTERLYIPHGSDETWIELTIPVALKYFISHMVQMKRSRYQQ